MIIEMRTYTTKPGRRSRFLELFCAKTVPAHTAIGMRTSGPFLSVEDPDTFFWMRGFADLASRERMKAEFYEGDLWKDELEGVLLPMLEKYEVVVVEGPAHLLHRPGSEVAQPDVTAAPLERREPCAERIHRDHDAGPYAVDDRQRVAPAGRWSERVAREVG